MKKRLSSIVFCSVLIILGIVIWVSSYSMKSLVDVSVGPGDVPRVLGILLVGLSSVELFNEAKSYKKDSAPVESEGHRFLCWENMKLPVTVLLSVLFVLALEPVGFVISCVVYLFCQILVYSEDKSRKAVIFYAVLSLVCGIAIYSIFVYGFTLRLPNGILRGLF